MHQIGIRHSNIPTSFCGEKGIPIQYPNEKTLFFGERDPNFQQEDLFFWRKGSEFPRRPFLEEGIRIPKMTFLSWRKGSESQQFVVGRRRSEFNIPTKRLFLFVFFLFFFVFSFFVFSRFFFVFYFFLFLFL